MGSTGEIGVMGVAEADDGSGNGHPEGRSDLAAGRGDGGRDSSLRERHAGNGAVGDGGIDHAQAKTEEGVGEEQQRGLAL